MVSVPNLWTENENCISVTRWPDVALDILGIIETVAGSSADLFWGNPNMLRPRLALKKSRLKTAVTELIVITCRPRPAPQPRSR